MSSSQSKGLIVFDLDGTLLDTFDDVTTAANHVLDKRGLEPFDTATVKRYVGSGGRQLLRDLLSLRGVESEGEDLEAAFDAWKHYYEAHPVRSTHPYEGMDAALTALRDSGFRLAVLSNKADPVVQGIATHFGLSRWFEAIRGESPDTPRKPDPAGLVSLMRHASVTPDATLVVGDGAADMRVAANAKAPALAVSYGVTAPERLRSLGARAVVGSLPEVVEWVEGNWKKGAFTAAAGS